MMSREIRLAARPAGMPTLEAFEFATVDLGALADGQVLVQNIVMSVDPYMRGRMNDAKSYVPPFKVGAALEGGAVGRVVESRSPHFAAGDIVVSMMGWRDTFIADPRALTKVDPDVRPYSAWLGVLGVTGFTAWAGLRLVDVAPGDRVFISGAAGGVGVIAGQLAKLRGCTVIGSAGSAEKVALLTESLGFDAAFNYRDGNLYQQLKAAAPDGIDVYFDNVGGEHLEAAIFAMRNFGRIIACGSIAGYNEPVPGPRNMMMFISKRLTMKGLIVFDAEPDRALFVSEISALLAAGTLRAIETEVHGLDQAPAAFLGLFEGANTGKMIVTL
jgi:NADPH-dependent curcumin reductase CurA